MIIQSSFSEGLEVTGCTAPFWEVTISPAEIDSLPHNPYRPEYSWLFTLERMIARRAEPEMSLWRHDLIGSRGILTEALSNAYCHAHGRDRDRPIHISVYKHGLNVLIRIQDSGPGFPVDETVRRCLEGKRHFKLAGNGMRRMLEHPTLVIFYDDEGRAFHVLQVPDPVVARLGAAQYRTG